jgi:hypothetical protein
MSPDFRQRLYAQLVAIHRCELATLRGELCSASPHAEGHDPSDAPAILPGQAFKATDGDALVSQAAATVTSMGRGQRFVTRTHPHAGSFSTFTALPDEYARHELAGRMERLNLRLAQVMVLLLLLFLQIRTQPHLGCCLCCCRSKERVP